MSILGKIGAGLKQFGKYYTSPEGLQTLSAVVSDYGQEDSPNYTALMARREKLAQQQRQQQAIAGLLGSYRGPDMETQGVNELIGGANETGSRFNMAPMQRQAARWQQGFDLGNPDTQTVIANYLGAGGSLANVKLMVDMGRGPTRKAFNVGDGNIVSVDEEGNAEVAYSSPLLQQQTQARIDLINSGALKNQQQGSAALINANRPRSTGRTGSGQVGPTPTGRTY